MTHEQINALTVESCQEILVARLLAQEITEPTQEQLEAELVDYKAELTAVEDARIALEQLTARVVALEDAVLLVGLHIANSPELLAANGDWNPVGFEVHCIQNPNCGFWRFGGLPKPTLEQLEAIKASLINN